MYMDIPKRRLGKTGIDVTILGLGGEGVLRTYGYEKDAYRSFPGRPAADVSQALNGNPRRYPKTS